MSDLKHNQNKRLRYCSLPSGHAGACVAPSTHAPPAISEPIKEQDEGRGCPARKAYFIALITAIDRSGISPGFARVSHECASGFEITLTIPQWVVDNFAARETATAPPLPGDVS